MTLPMKIASSVTISQRMSRPATRISRNYSSGPGSRLSIVCSGRAKELRQLVGLVLLTLTAGIVFLSLCNAPAQSLGASSFHSLCCSAPWRSCARSVYGPRVANGSKGELLCDRKPAPKGGFRVCGEGLYCADFPVPALNSTFIVIWPLTVRRRPFVAVSWTLTFVDRRKISQLSATVARTSAQLLSAVL